jgi:hypothetical protein
VTPDDFVLEHWKAYGEYMQRKERLVEVAVTLYLAFVSSLFWHDGWARYVSISIAFWLGGAVLLLAVFVTSQMSLLSSGARISNACQTLMTRWLTTAPTANDLEEATRPGEMAGVGLPNALWREMDVRRVRYRNQSWWRWVLAKRFEIAVYGLILLATVALAVRVWSVRFNRVCE